MANSFVFSSESVGEGHPDKVADFISDSILDACLAFDRNARVACETFVKSNTVIVGGEITLPKLQDKTTGRSKPIDAAFNVNQVIREAIREIGYTHDDDIFHADTAFITNTLTAQSADIAQGVDARSVEGKKTAEQGAGDQGLIFGFASDETEEFMPAPVIFAHRLGRELTRLRKSGKVAWLRPDAKSQVSVRYVDGRVAEIVNVVVSTQHSADVKHAEIERFIIDNVIKKVLPAELLTGNTEFLVNPTGKFVVGGPQGDSGLTGRKIIVDSYGGWGRHGGGAFSGKDPSKVDRSAAYMCRWVAKNIVAAGLAKQCELQVAYAIGHPKPVSVYVNTFGTGTVSDEQIVKAIDKVFSFKPADIIEQLDLLHPFYRQTTQYGHFGKAGLPWEKTDKVSELKAAIETGAEK
ncbi:S-adenosylmethionine synthetase [Cephaloticoccus primus]|uniref:S-adenosylmethionine synthase n=1 Tax=Cephaloticoccus primus TaxID=1548207 RepID=A0A139SPR9_9BACT|nr:methionine adenosyltransferase [Cephaloticoccus primus]KXU36589.1 S-adenosylmethionine synthetase [Cephaloticoccus primus]